MSEEQAKSQPQPQTQPSSVSVSAPIGDETQADGYSFADVTELLDVAPGTLRRWTQRFADFLGEAAQQDDPLFSQADADLLGLVRGMLAEGQSYEQIAHRLSVLVTAQHAPEGDEAMTALATVNGAAMPPALNAVLHTIADGQHALANSQAASRELMGVVVQDNFNLKDENRKLRDRMLELERSLAEYQRREETRKERLENRLRALESTTAALQQQVAQLVQFARQGQKRRGWFW